METLVETNTENKILMEENNNGKINNSRIY